MRTLTFKAQPTNAFSLQSIGGSSQVPTTAEPVSLTELCSTIDNRALGSSRGLVGAAKHLIDVGEKRIRQLSFEF